jgi:hypothetical protein
MQMVTGNVHAHNKGVDGFAAVFNSDNRAPSTSLNTSLKGVANLLSRVVGRTLTTDEVKGQTGFRADINEDDLLKFFPK